MQINTHRIRPGDWGNMILVHENAGELVHAVMPEVVLQSQQQLLSLVHMYRTAATERLELIQHLRSPLKFFWKAWLHLLKRPRGAKG